MAITANYVKFYRGSPEAYANIKKDNNTLYFVYDSNSDKGSLYLGDRLISGNVSNITDLEDLIITELQDKQILQYDIAQSAWVNKSIKDAIDIMVGATKDTQGSIGLVPAPGIGQQNLFLRGDGVWASPGTSNSTDDKSITIVNNVLTLKDFGIKYYKYVEATGSEETGDFVPAHYEAQIVDDSHPWLEGLEPKVVNDNGNLVIGWFEPNTITVDGLSDTVSNLSNQVNKNTQSISNITKQLDNKANSSDVYTKTETDDLIDEKISSASHLKREVFNTILEATAFAESHAKTADQYVYMVLNPDSDNENDKYDEYLYINGSLEKVGSWAADLSQYVKKEEGKSLVLDTEITKLATVKANAEENFIKKVNIEQFNVTDDGQLNLNKIKVAQIENLSDWITKNRDTVDGLLSTEQEQKINSGIITSVNPDIFEVSEAGALNIKQVPVSLLTDLSDDFAYDENNKLILSEDYVTVKIYKAEIGDFNQLNHTVNEKSTVIDEINAINKKLQWNELT